jgi:uncharacterized membrane protein (UPF0127 family)
MPPTPFKKLTVFPRKHRLKPLFAHLLVVLTLAAPGMVFAQNVRFASTTLQAGMHLITAEVADDNPKRMQGLMYRRELPGNNGMVFVFDQADAHCMWMKNTLIPLSVAFIDEGGQVLNVADMQPQSEANHCAQGKARFALEMRQGWFAAKGVKAGDRVGGVDRLVNQRQNK